MQAMVQTIEFNDLTAGRTADELRGIVRELEALPRNAHAVVTTDHGQCEVCWHDVPMTAAAAVRELAGLTEETEAFWGG